jgi:transcriptional regulator with XRE-family HTH domain
MERAHRIFPNTLTLHRKTLGYSQRQVAALIGLHDTVPISLWERGVKMPNAINLIKLSLIYRTYPNELYGDVFYSLREELKTKEHEQFKKI